MVRAGCSTKEDELEAKGNPDAQDLTKKAQSHSIRARPYSL